MNELGGGIAGIIALLLMSALPSAVGIVIYVLYSKGLYDMAKKRGVSYPGLAWVPVASNYTLGKVCGVLAIGDKRIKKPELLLLLLNIGMAVLGVILFAVSMATFLPAYFSYIMTAAETGAEIDPEVISELLMGAGITLTLFSFLISALSTVVSVFTYIAYYRIFKLFDPQHAVIYLVLSILLGINFVFFFIASKKAPAEYLPDQPGYQPPAPPPYGQGYAYGAPGQYPPQPPYGQHNQPPQPPYGQQYNQPPQPFGQQYNQPPQPPQQQPPQSTDQDKQESNK